MLSHWQKASLHIRVVTAKSILKRYCSTSSGYKPLLQSLQSPESLAILRSEKKRFHLFDHENERLIKKLQKDILRYCQNPITEAVATEIYGSYEYFSKYTDRKPHAMLYRRLRSQLSKPLHTKQNYDSVNSNNNTNNDDSSSIKKEELVLDVNLLMSAIPNMTALARLKPSIDHTLLAFIVDLDTSTAIDNSSNPNPNPNFSMSSSSALFAKNIDSNTACRLDLSSALLCDATLLSHNTYNPSLSPSSSNSNPGLGLDATYSTSVVDFEWGMDSSGSSILYLVLTDRLHRPARVVQVSIDRGAFTSEMCNSNTNNSSNNNENKDKKSHHSSRNSNSIHNNDNGSNDDASRILKTENQITLRNKVVDREDLEEIVYEQDASYNVDIGRSKDDEYIIISKQSKSTSEISVIPVTFKRNPNPNPNPKPNSNPNSDPNHDLDPKLNLNPKSNLKPIPCPNPNRIDPVLLFRKQLGVKYYADHSDGYFYIATNKSSPNPDPKPGPNAGPNLSPNPSSNPSTNPSTNPSPNSIKNYPDNFNSSPDNPYPNQMSQDLKIVRLDSSKMYKDSIPNPNTSSYPSLTIPDLNNWCQIYPNPISDHDSINLHPTSNPNSIPYSDPNSNPNTKPIPNFNPNSKHINHISISDFDIFQNRLIVYGRCNGRPSVHTVSLISDDNCKDIRDCNGIIDNNDDDSNDDDSNDDNRKANDEKKNVIASILRQESVLEPELEPELGIGFGMNETLITDLTPMIVSAIGSNTFQINVGVNAGYDASHCYFSVSNPLTPG
jgi:hypothetical protein